MSAGWSKGIGPCLLVSSVAIQSGGLQRIAQMKHPTASSQTMAELGLPTYVNSESINAKLLERNNALAVRQ